MAATPAYSIIIPTLGRPQLLRACLRGVAALLFDLEGVEVVVVQDGATDSVTQDVVDEFSRDLRITYACTNVRAGPARARNMGASIAKGTNLVFTDDDCVPDPGWLNGFDAVLTDHFDVVMLGGKTRNADGVNLYAEASQNLLDFLYEWYNRDHRLSRFFATNNLLCPAAGFRQLGGFDVSFIRAAAEDRDFCDRWREHGRRLVYVPTAVVYHSHRSTFLAFLRQHAGYGRGAVDLHRGREQRGVGLPRLEPMGFYRRLVTFPVGRGNGLRTLPLVALAFASQAAYGFGYYAERFRRRWGRPSPSARRAPLDERVTSMPDNADDPVRSDL